ncbi:MAG: hypothetical protein ABSD28_04370 [Tepidisphaeraceae bacterium]|jgi:HTH-type transcriptional regulator / antitoxin HigA
MEIKSIDSERDYRRALKEIDTLMDAKVRTAAGDRLDILVRLAAAWEQKHHPIDAPDPLKANQFTMEQRN